MDKLLLQKYIADGLSTRKIAKAENLSSTTIKYWIKKYELKTEPKRKYTFEDIRRLVPLSKGISDLLKQLDLLPRGGNFYTIKRILSRENINTDHWVTGRGWSKDHQLKDWSNYNNSSSLRKILIKERGYKCEQCNLTQWMNVTLGMEMHHIDGDRTNNTKENLQLLCPNCHSITDNFKNRKRPVV